MVASTSAETTEIFTGVGSWIVCSMGMLVFNKMAVTVLPLQCTLVALQLAFTALAMVILCWKSLHFGSSKDVLRWLIVVPFFTGMLLTSMFALSEASMTTVVTFRAISPLIALSIERFYPNPVPVTGNILACIGLMIVGAILYAKQMPTSDRGAIGWLLVNNFFAIGDRLLQRLMLAKDQSPVDISKTGITLINNAAGLFVILIAGVFHSEVAAIPSVFAHMTPTDAFWVFASCIVSVGISYTGIWAQSLVTATSFLVLVNANKFFIIFLEALVMHTKQMTVMQGVGASIAILASAAYGKAREHAESGKDTEATPILAKP